MFRTSSRRQQMFREALSRESGKGKKTIDRGEGFRNKFPYGVFLLWISFLGVMGYTVFFSSYLSITHVEVSQAGQITDQELRTVVEPILETKQLFIFPAKNFFLLPQDKIKQALLAISPVIESVTVERIFPDTLSILPHERDELLLWCAGGPCAMLNDKNEAWIHEKVFESRYDSMRLSVIDTSALPFELGKPLPVKDYLTYLSLLHQKAPASLGVSLAPEAFTPSRFSRELRLTVSEGWTLLVNIDIPINETLLSLKAFLDERHKLSGQSAIATIDVRVPGRIFFTEIGNDEIKTTDSSQTSLEEKVDKKEVSTPVKKKRSE